MRFPYAHDPEQGSGTDLDTTAKGGKGGSYFKVDPPNPNIGDGTVPRSSASALKDKVIGTCTVSGVEHSAFYSNTTVQKATYHFIEKLADSYKKQVKPT